MFSFGEQILGQLYLRLNINHLSDKISLSCMSIGALLLSYVLAVPIGIYSAFGNPIANNTVRFISYLGLACRLFSLH